MPIEDDDHIRTLLSNAKTIAVVGASNKLLRDSNRIALFLKQKGYTVIPVNPNYSAIGEDRCYPDLQTIGMPVDIVDIFRNPEAVDEIIDDAIAARAKSIWMQLGVVNQIAAAKAEAAGLSVIMDHCIAVDYSRLMR